MRSAAGTRAVSRNLVSGLSMHQEPSVPHTTCWPPRYVTVRADGKAAASRSIHIPGVCPSRVDPAIIIGTSGPAPGATVGTGSGANV